MKKVFRLILVFCAVLAAAVCADEKDQYWMTGGVSWKIDDDFSFKFSNQIRIRDEDFYYNHTDVGVGYNISKNWNVVPTYRHQRSKNGKGDWKTTNGYMLDINNSVNAFELELKSRMRLAYFHPREANKDSSTEARPRFELLPAKGFTQFDIKPYIADEMMYNFDEHKFFRNRFSVGVKFKPVKELSMDVFVMNEQNRNDGVSRWEEQWNCGFAGTVSF